jgi:hypothetical protein
MRALVRAWNTFWFRPISARPLGAFRVVMGVLALTHLALLWVDLDYWLTDHGLFMGSETREMAGPFRLSPLQWVQDPVSVRVFVVASAVVAALFTVGWRTRLMGVLLYLAVLSIHHRNIATNCGADDLLLVMLFYLMLSPCGAAYSLDARRAASRRGGTAAEPLIVPWAQRLIQLQLSLIYFNTAVLKCAGITWLNGTAMHYVLNNPEVGRFDFSYLSQYPVLLNLLSHTALFVELALPFLLWFRATRPWLIAAGLALHGGVLLIINVPLFGELMTACYLPFLDPDELDRLLRALNPLRWARSAGLPRPEIPGRVDAAQAPQGPHAPAPEPTAFAPGRAPEYGSDRPGQISA